ncbi:MAG TPA: hypothetical protein VLW50_14855 [Streptosporangiaceae bacterium]|nr:hypothetical protein [Streptosporangiaceae bacterium]
MKRHRKGKGMPLWVAFVILAAISAVAAVWWLVLPPHCGARTHRRHYQRHGAHPNLYYTYGRGAR